MKISICNTTTDEKGKELLEHGTALFPISCYEDDLTIMNVPWHWHEEFEVLYVTEGNPIVLVGTTQYTLNEGEGFFINSGIPHSVQKGNSATSKIRSIVFHPRIIGGGVDSIYWQKYIQPIISNPLLAEVYFDNSESWHNSAIHQIIKAWSTCTSDSPGYEFDVRTFLSSMIFCLSQNCPINIKRPSDKILKNNERLKCMLLFIQQNYTNQISVSMIAESALISESECMRCFRSTMNTSPIKYLKHFRLEQASNLLSTSDNKIIDIGMACGFQDISYFIKSFKTLYDLTPSEFQKKNKK
jgi:AraC-like DNA-binding protein/mannose-6-phosphate isomerase-like protein (cupin superfamily)